MTCASRASTLRYPGADRDAVADLTLSVPAGSTLALVGADRLGQVDASPGCSRGCTTRTPGRVTVDGIDVRDLDPDVLASVVGVVSQESYLVHASVRDNLLLARPAATEGELWAALAAAQVADLVASLPDGLETVVGARGHRFSGGEQQRLAVARTHPARPAGARARRGDQRARHRHRAGAAARRSTSWPAGAPPSPSPTGSRPCATPTGSRCSTAAGSWSRARTTSSWPPAAGTPPWSPPPSRRRPPDPRAHASSRRRRHQADPDRGTGLAGETVWRRAHLCRVGSRALQWTT